MTCNVVTNTDGGLVVVCSRGPHILRRCVVCHRSERQTALVLCDAVVRPDATRRRTCDEALCAQHATHQDPDTDFCPAHARETRQDEPQPTRITSFRGAYFFLSNFYPAEVWYERQSFRAVETAYQAAKTLDARERGWIREASGPRQARQRGRRVTLRDDWHTGRVDVMRHLLRQKFTRHAALRDKLLDTGHAVLIASAPWGDHFWGVCNDQGKNMLGILLMEIRMELQQELNWSTLKQASAPSQEDTHDTPSSLPLQTPPTTGTGSDGVVVPAALSPHEVLLQLCADLHKAGIYLSLSATGTLIAGPTIQVKKHPRLLDGIRAHKQHLLHLIEDSLAYQLFGTNQDDRRFETETCADCQQAVHVVTPPRRLAVHRLPHTEDVCPGSARAQHACALQLLDAFLDDCAVPRHSAALTWTALNGAFSAWSLRLGWLRPPRPYLIQAMDARFPRLRDTDEERPIWSGLTLKLEEWYGEDEPRPVVPETAQERKPAQVSVRNGKVTLRA